MDAACVAKSEELRKSEKRLGDEISQDIGFYPASLTAAEAAYVLNFRDADTFRDRIAEAQVERDSRLRAKGVRPSLAAAQRDGWPLGAAPVTPGTAALLDEQRRWPPAAWSTACHGRRIRSERARSPPCSTRDLRGTRICLPLERIFKHVAFWIAGLMRRCDRNEFSIPGKSAASRPTRTDDCSGVRMGRSLALKCKATGGDARRLAVTPVSRPPSCGSGSRPPAVRAPPPTLWPGRALQR